MIGDRYKICRKFFYFLKSFNVTHRGRIRYEDTRRRYDVTRWCEVGEAKRRRGWDSHVEKGNTRGEALTDKGIPEALYGRELGRRPQGRPKMMRWVGNVQANVLSLEIRDLAATAYGETR